MSAMGREQQRLAEQWGYSEFGNEQTVSSCTLRYDDQRGVIYIDSDEMGTTLVRVQGVDCHRNLCVNGYPEMLDVKVKVEA